MVMVVLERGDVRRKGGYQNRLSKNVRYSVHNVNACFNTFSFSFKLLLGENTFLWNISKRLLRVDILQKSYSENFLKIHQKTPLKLEESLFNYVADSILEILQKCNLNQYVFLQILRIFQSDVSLKNFVRLPLDEVDLFCKNASPKYVQKLCQKYVTNVANY